MSRYVRMVRLALERLATRDDPQDHQQEHSAKEGEHDAADVETGHVPAEQEASHEAAQEGTNDTHDDVADNAKAMAATSRVAFFTRLGRFWDGT